MTTPPPYLVHLDDHTAFDLKGDLARLIPGVRYERVTLLSDAADFVRSGKVTGFIVDLQLPFERLEHFQDWGPYPKTSYGLIKWIRQEHPEVPVVVLTDFFEDAGVEELVNEGVLPESNRFRKLALKEDIGRIIEVLLTPVLPRSR